jgi:hypothetical protein
MHRFISERNNAPEIFWGLRISLSHKSELSLHEHAGHFEHLLQENKRKRLLIDFLFFLLYLGSI